MSPAVEAADRVPGFMSVSELETLAELASRARLIVEVGSWKGRSTKAIAMSTPGVLYAVDDWSGFWGPGAEHETRVWEEFEGHLCDEMGAGKVRPVRCCSIEAAAEFAEAGAQFDLVFLDADHTYEAVQADIAAWAPMVASGGILCGHDYHRGEWPGVVRAVNEFVNELGTDLKVSDTIWQVTL